MIARMNNIKNRLEMEELDKRHRIPHHQAWTALEAFYNMTPNDTIDMFPSSMGNGDYWSQWSLHAAADNR